MRIFLICPVRYATEEQKNKLLSYIDKLRKDGHNVYYPAIETNQNDPIGFRICLDNRKAIYDADEVHVFWDKNSKGSLFDLGMAFAYDMPIYIINKEDIEPNEGKSFENMICYWEMESEDTEKDWSK